MKNFQVDSSEFPWKLPEYDYSWIFMVPGDWSNEFIQESKGRIWTESEFEPIFSWLMERCYGSFYAEMNTCRDGIETPVEVHIKGRRNAMMFKLTWG